MAGELVELIRSRIDADFDGECHLTKEEALSIIGLIDHLRDNSRIEALERENATLRAERAAIIEKAAVIADEYECHLADYGGSVDASNFYEAGMLDAGQGIAAAIRNMGGEG